MGVNLPVQAGFSPWMQDGRKLLHLEDRVSKDAADRRTISRRLLLGALAAAPLLLASEEARADGQDRGRGRGGGEGRGRGRDDGPRRHEREDSRRYERYEDRRYGPRGYGDGPDVRRGRVLPPQSRGGRIEDYERYRLRQPPRGYSWYRSGDGFALVGPNGIVFDVID